MSTNNIILCPYCTNKTVDLGICELCGSDLSHLEAILSLALKYYKNGLAYVNSKQLSQAYEELIVSTTLFPHHWHILNLDLLLCLEMGDYERALSIFNHLKPWLDDNDHADILATLETHINTYHDLIDSVVISDTIEPISLVHDYLMYLKTNDKNHIEKIREKETDFHPHSGAVDPYIIINHDRNPYKIKWSIGATVVTILCLLGVIGYVQIRSNQNAKTISVLNATLRHTRQALSVKDRELYVVSSLHDFESKFDEGKMDVCAEMLIREPFLISHVTVEEKNTIANTLYQRKRFDLLSKFTFDYYWKPHVRYFGLLKNFNSEVSHGGVSATTLIEMDQWLIDYPDFPAYFGELALILSEYYNHKDTSKSKHYAVQIKDWASRMPHTSDYQQYLNNNVLRRIAK